MRITIIIDESDKESFEFTNAVGSVVDLGHEEEKESHCGNKDCICEAPKTVGFGTRVRATTDSIRDK